MSGQMSIQRRNIKPLHWAGFSNVTSPKLPHTFNVIHTGQNTDHRSLLARKIQKLLNIILKLIFQNPANTVTKLSLSHESAVNYLSTKTENVQGRDGTIIRLIFWVLAGTITPNYKTSKALLLAFCKNTPEWILFWDIIVSLGKEPKLFRVPEEICSGALLGEWYGVLQTTEPFSSQQSACSGVETHFGRQAMEAPAPKLNLSLAQCTATSYSKSARG